MSTSEPANNEIFGAKCIDVARTKKSEICDIFMLFMAFLYIIYYQLLCNVPNYNLVHGQASQLASRPAKLIHQITPKSN